MKAKRILAMLLLIIMVIPMAVPANAAAEGTMVSNAVNVIFGTQYFKGWTPSSDHLNHYSKFTVTSKGIITITATKPYDSEGEYGDIEFAVYNKKNYELVYANESYTACDDPKPYYEISFGVAPGEYYFTMLPGFSVSQGLIETYYTVSFQANNNCEQEPNGSGPKATSLNLGYYHKGFLCSDGSYDAEEYDYWKFNVTAGHKYRIYVKNFETIASTYTSVYLIMPGESADSIRYYLERNVDSNGVNYREIEAEKSGTAYLYFEGSHYKKQFEYSVAVVDLSLANINGWVREGNYWAYYQNGMKLSNQWKKDSTGWCYLDANGYMATNKWIKDSAGWCYVGSNGYCVTNQWKKDSNGWCYLDANGRMATHRWIKDSAGWCYVGGNGYCVTNKWVKDSYGWCYLDANGRMATNKWVQDSKGWCYVGSNGYAVTNCWKQDSVGWCYLDANGSMLKYTWFKSNGKTYFIDKNGYMVTGTVNIGGKSYTFNGNGELVG